MIMKFSRFLGISTLICLKSQITANALKFTWSLLYTIAVTIKKALNAQLVFHCKGLLIAFLLNFTVFKLS